MGTFQRSGSFAKFAESGGTCSGAIPSGPGEESDSDVLNPGYGPVGEGGGTEGNGATPGTPDGPFVCTVSSVVGSKTRSLVSGPLIWRLVRSMVWNPSFSALSSYDAGVRSTTRKMPSASVQFSRTTTPARSRLIFAPGMPSLVRGSRTVPCREEALVGKCPGMCCACPGIGLVHAIRTRNATHALAANDALARLMFMARNFL